MLKPVGRNALMVFCALVVSCVGVTQSQAAFGFGAERNPAELGGSPHRFASAPETELTSWYGYQLLLSDAAFVGLGLATDRAEVWLPGYLGAPILLHALHRRTDLAIVSPLMRLMLPLIGIAIGRQHRSCNANGDECEIGGAIVGGSVGAAVAVLLDWGLAWERRAVPAIQKDPLRPEDQRPEKAAGISVTTAGFVPRDDGVRLVLCGTF